MTEPQAAQDRVLIFDTTLRDGEQSPGATMTLEEKLQIATLLDEMGVDIIEAGFPIASEGDFEAVAAIARSAQQRGDLRPRPRQLRRHRPLLGGGAPRQAAAHPHLHRHLAAPPRVSRTSTRTRWPSASTTPSPTPATSATTSSGRRWTRPAPSTTIWPGSCEIAIKAGATTINIPDTVGYTAPRESAALIRMLIERVPGADEVVFATHCHNDLGMATANSLAAVEAGARQIECTINGLGERAGNTALEEVVMAMRVRNDIMPYRDRHRHHAGSCRRAGWSPPSRASRCSSTRRSSARTPSPTRAASTRTGC